MIADTNIKTYYAQFIYKNKVEKNKATARLKEIKTIIHTIKESLEQYVDKLKEQYNIDLNKYTEWTDEEYNLGEALYSIVHTNHSHALNSFDKAILSEFIRYCNYLRQSYTMKKIIKMCNKRLDIKFGVYRDYIKRYYQEVHKQVLLGNGYKFTNGIGTFCINHWKLPKGHTARPMLDYQATNEKKKQLLAEGKELYDDKKAVWFKARNIPYNGVEYRVFKNEADYYQITFINSRIVYYSSYEYEHTEYINVKLRGLSYTEIADKYCKNLDDIVAQQVDIRYKLNMYKYINPGAYLNYIRNAEQNKYKHRKDYSENRQ